jgi:short-chain fatty acids transporter
VIQRISAFFTQVVHRVLPDPLIFAILLTVVTFALAFGLTPKAPADLVMLWGSGFWNLLAFSMQMAMILVTGHALASSGPVKRMLVALASSARTPGQGVMLVSFVGAVACAINWGFGLVLGAMLAREVARRVQGTDYRLLVACAYMGFLTWHGGLSGSVPLVAATHGNPMEKTIGLIPVSQTIFTGYNAFITFGLIILLPILARLMMPKPEDVVTVDPALLQDPPSVERKLSPDATFAERMEESRVLAILVAALCAVFLIIRFIKKGFVLDIDGLCARGSGGGQGRIRHHDSVSVLCRDPGTDGPFGPGRRHYEMVCRHCQRSHLSVACISQLGADQLCRTLRRRSLGGPGSVCDARGASARCGPGQIRYGDCVR